MNGTVAPSSRSCTVAATSRGCTFNSVAMRWTILSATVSVMGVCVSLLAHQGLFVPRISLAFHCKPREHVCRVGEAGHFAINAGGLRRAVIEFRDRRSCFFTPLSVSLFVSLPITLAITLPTSRLSSALPTAPVDSFAATGPAASGGGVAIVRQVLPFARPVAAILFALTCAGVGTAAMAQTPKPINPGTSVTQTPLDESGAQGTAAQAASGDSASRAAGQIGANGAIDAGEAQDTVDPNGFSARQKALDVRSAENNYRYGVKQHDCYSDFFVNHCLDKARDAKRAVAQQIRKEHWRSTTNSVCNTRSSV